MELQDYLSNHPVPGESLTANPDEKLPFQLPPEYTGQQEAMDFIWSKLTSDAGLRGLFNLLRKDVPVADIAQVVTFTGFAEGKWNYDLVLQLLEPVIFMIMYLAYKANISFVYSREIPSLEAAFEEAKSPSIIKEMKASTPYGLMSKKEDMFNG